MNGILGYLRLDGAPMAPVQLERMQAAMSFWGVDGGAVWSRGPAGLGCQFCFCTPEETRGLFPFYDRELGFALTAGAFLDNRAELLDKLGRSGAVGPDTPDSLLVLLACRRWGEECVHHLLGDWHFALWNEKAGRLFLARDHCGNTGLCYTHGPGFFAFASSRKALLALPEVPRVPNLLRLAQTLTSWPGDGVQTAYAGIHRLPPAHCLSLTAGTLQITRYWSAEQVREVHLRREADYLEAFLEQYDRAVQARLRSRTPVSATLSGGLDSGSVCALAARTLARNGRRLTAFTAIPLEDTTPYTPQNRCGDESARARATARQAGNIDLTVLSAAGITPLAGVARLLKLHDEPGHAAANYFWMAALLEQVRKQEFRVLLTGQGGNATVSWAGGPVSLWPELLHGKMDEFRRRFRELRRRHGLSLLGGIRRFLAGPLILPLQRRLQFGLLSPGPVFLHYSAIHPGWAKSLHLERRMRSRGHNPYLLMGYDPRQIRSRRIRAVGSETGAWWGESSGAYGLEVRDPTVDRRLWEFCLGIPEIFHVAQGRDRAVLRRAFQGILPDTVRLNRMRGWQAADICRRVRDQGKEVEEALRRLERHSLAPAVLDLPRMRRVLASLQRETTPANTVAAITILLRGLGVGMFLERF